MRSEWLAARAGFGRYDYTKQGTYKKFKITFRRASEIRLGAYGSRVQQTTIHTMSSNVYFTTRRMRFKMVNQYLPVRGVTAKSA
jgi:hypothetical protein